MRRVAVVDDHRVLADLFSHVIESADDLTLVGRADSVEACLATAAGWAADVVVMDVRLGDGDGIALTEGLTRAFPELCVIVLTAHVDAVLVRRATAARACALLPKDGDLDLVLRTIRAVEPRHRGRIRLHPQLQARLTGGPPGRPPSRLTEREQEVLRLLASGMDVRQIGRETGTTVNTARGHVKSILAKLDAHSQLEAVAIALRHDLLGTPIG